MRVWQRVNFGVKVRGLTQTLITVANTNSNASPTKPNFTNSTYLPTLSALHLYPTFYPLPHPHARILPNAFNNHISAIALQLMETIIVITALSNLPILQ